MFHGDLYCAEKTMHRRLQDERASFEALRLSRAARLAGALQPGWMARQSCWLLCQIGRLLVAMGLRMERYGLSQTLSFEGEPGRSS
jgi:hypothetical protein